MIDTNHLETQVVHTLVPGWGMVRHLKVRRYDGRDGITWDELQAIKDERLGPEVVAIEVYPRAEDLVNEVNVRHLWEVPPWVVAPNMAVRACTLDSSWS